MTLRRSVLSALLALPTGFAVACGCLTFDAGTLTIRTDCEGEPSDTELQFAIVPGVDELGAQFESIAFLECDLDSSADTLSCDALGSGVQEGGALALLCGTKMQVVKLITLDSSAQVYVHCEAPIPVGDGSLWPMSCKYRDPAGAEVTGPGGAKSCQAIAQLVTESVL